MLDEVKSIFRIEKKRQEISGLIVLKALKFGNWKIQYLTFITYWTILID